MENRLFALQFLINGPSRPFLVYFFSFFQQTLHILQQIDVKIFHPVIGAGIQTPDLQNVSLLP